MVETRFPPFFLHNPNFRRVFQTSVACVDSCEQGNLITKGSGDNSVPGGNRMAGPPSEDHSAASRRQPSAAVLFSFERSFTEDRVPRQSFACPRRNPASTRSLTIAPIFQEKECTMRTSHTHNRMTAFHLCLLQSARCLVARTYATVAQASGLPRVSSLRLVRGAAVTAALLFAFSLGAWAQPTAFT